MLLSGSVAVDGVLATFGKTGGLCFFVVCLAFGGFAQKMSLPLAHAPGALRAKRSPLGWCRRSTPSRRGRGAATWRSCSSAGTRINRSSTSEFSQRDTWERKFMYYSYGLSTSFCRLNFMYDKRPQLLTDVPESRLLKRWVDPFPQRGILFGGSTVLWFDTCKRGSLLNQWSLPRDRNCTVCLPSCSL